MQLEMREKVNKQWIKILVESDAYSLGVTPLMFLQMYSKMSHNTRLKSNRFILNHELLERCSFVKCV